MVLLIKKIAFVVNNIIKLMKNYSIFIILELKSLLYKKENIIIWFVLIKEI